jgi:UDPglucose 6-dehydrogenase
MILGDGQLARATRANVGDTDLCWVCHDTPVDADDRPDVDWVLDAIRPELARLEDGDVVLISSQLPVGTCARLEGEFPHLRFAVSPENIRVKTGAEDFRSQARTIVGTRHDDLRPRFEELFAPFSHSVIFMSPESAEMAKHALNGYLAACIVFINEIAAICDRVGADVEDVTTALLTEPRVSPSAPLRAGPTYSGGTLGRDIRVLADLAGPTLFAAIIESSSRYP